MERRRSFTSIQTFHTHTHRHICADSTDARATFGYASLGTRPHLARQSCASPLQYYPSPPAVHCIFPDMCLLCEHLGSRSCCVVFCFLPLMPAAGWTKMSAKDMRLASEWYDAGESCSEIADKRGRNKSAITRLLVKQVERRPRADHGWSPMPN